MYGPPRQSIHNNSQWNYHRPTYNPHWNHAGGPRGPVRGYHQSFNQYKPSFPTGNDNYWCETCDRGFPTQDLLNKHIKQHEKCNIDGCTFVAHPKMITKHIQMQHSTGLYKKIAKLNNPEDIEKWREERRKKYPTKNNIEKKAAELKEKINRGEKMGLERNRFNKDRQHKNNSEQNRNNRHGQGVKRGNNIGCENQPRSKFPKNNNIAKRNRKPPAPKTLPLIEERKLKPFAGILQLQMDFEDNEEKNTDHQGFSDLIEDYDNEEIKPIEIKTKDTSTNREPVVCEALASLMFDYGSSDEEEYNTDNVNKIKKNTHEMKGQCNFLENINMKTGSSKKPSMETLERIIQCDAKLKNENKDAVSTAHGQIVNVKESTSSKSKILEVIECGAELNKKIIDPEVNGQNEEDGANDSGPEETKVVKYEDTVVNPTGTPKLKNPGVRPKFSTEKRQIMRRPKSKLPSTLLHKLLFKEMQQERNIVLQCIRYIRRNNYFDKK